jgi:hypothetical protein
VPKEELAEIVLHEGILFAMRRLTCACALLIALHALGSAPAAQSVYSTGTTIYDPDRSWNGFTVLSPLATHVVAASGARPPHQESLELIQRDFEGNVL